MDDPLSPALLDLIGVAERLWPDAEEVVLARRRGRAHGGGGSVLELLAAPDASRPRVLLPAHGRAAAAAVQRFSAALSAREVLQRRALGMVLTCGGARMPSDRIRVVKPGEDHIVALLEDVLGQKVSVSLGVGSERANRKPVLGVFDYSGRPVAFAKIGDSPVSASHVLSEVRSLEQVNDRVWDVVEPPQMLAHRNWRGMEVLVMSALRPPAWRGRGIWPIPVSAADEVSQRFAEEPCPLDATPMWHRCTAVVPTLTDAGVRDQLTEAMECVREAAGDREVDVGGFHGDFTPWNLARSGTKVMLWDWERFETGVPRGLDRIHYAVNAALRADGLKVDSVFSGLRAASVGAGSGGQLESVIAAAYLVSVSCRYLSVTVGAGGGAAVPRATTILSALTQLTRRGLRTPTGEGVQ